MSTQEWEALEKKAEAILEIAGDDDDENIYKEKGLLTQETLHEQGEVYQETLRILKNLDKKENQDILLEVFRHYNKTINYDDIQGIKLSELSEAEIMKETGLTSFPAVLEIPIPVWYPYFIVDSNNKIVDGYFNKNECLGDKNIN